MRGVLEQPRHEENSCEDTLKVRTKIKIPKPGSLLELTVF